MEATGTAVPTGRGVASLQGLTSARSTLRSTSATPGVRQATCSRRGARGGQGSRRCRCSFRWTVRSTSTSHCTPTPSSLQPPTLCASTLYAASASVHALACIRDRACTGTWTRACVRVACVSGEHSTPSPAPPGCAVRAARSVGRQRAPALSRAAVARRDRARRRRRPRARE